MPKCERLTDGTHCTSSLGVQGLYSNSGGNTGFKQKQKGAKKKKKKSPEFKANNMPFLWSYFSKILNFGLSLENKNQIHPLCTLPNMPPWGGRAYPRAARSIRRQHKGGQCQLPITGYPITQPQLGRSSAF